MRTNIALLSEETNNYISELKHSVEDTLSAIVNDPFQNETQLVQANAYMANVQSAMEEAREIQDTLQDIHTVVDQVDEMDDVSMEALRVAVEALMVRTGLRTKSFSLEHHGQTSPQQRLKVAIEGIGSFIVSIIKAIVNAIKKVIETIVNFFKWLFGANDKLSSAGTLASSHSKKIDNEFKQVNLNCKAYAENYLNAVGPNLGKTLQPEIEKTRASVDEMKRKMDAILRPDPAKRDAFNKYADEIQSLKTAIAKQTQICAATTEKYNQAADKSAMWKRDRFLTRPFYNASGEVQKLPALILDVCQEYVNEFKVLKDKHFTASRAQSCFKAIDGAISDLFTNMAFGDYGVRIHDVPYLQINMVPNTTKSEKGAFVSKCDATGYCFVFGNSDKTQHGDLSYADHTLINDLNKVRDDVKKNGTDVSDTTYAYQISQLKTKIVAAAKSWSLVKYITSDVACKDAESGLLNNPHRPLNSEQAVKAGELNIILSGLADLEYVKAMVNVSEKMETLAHGLLQKAKKAEGDINVRDHSEKVLKDLTDASRAFIEIYNVQYVQLYARMANQAHALAVNLHGYIVTSNNVNESALEYAKVLQEHDEIQAKLKQLELDLEKAQANHRQATDDLMSATN
jgi:Asp-tRNA(Asn)/Glu-tRNA(Gln) amidotransferase C subunit